MSKEGPSNLLVAQICLLPTVSEVFLSATYQGRLSVHPPKILRFALITIAIHFLPLIAYARI